MEVVITTVHALLYSRLLRKPSRQLAPE